MSRLLCFFLLLFFVQCATASAPPWMMPLKVGMVNMQPDKDGKGSLIVRTPKGPVPIPFLLMKPAKVDQQKTIFGFIITFKKVVQPVVTIDEEDLLSPVLLTPAAFMDQSAADEPPITLEEAERRCNAANEEMMAGWNAFMSTATKVAGEAKMPRGITVLIIQNIAEQQFQVDRFIVDPESGSVWRQD